MKNTLMKLGTAIGRWLLLAAAPTILLAGCSDDDEAVAVTELRLNKPTLALQIGATERLTATVLPADAEDKTVTWTSSDPAVATVDATGLVSAVAAGTTTVTAQSGGKSATCTVTVSKIPVERVVLSKTSLSLSLEQSEQLAATVTPDDATDRQVTWTDRHGQRRGPRNGCPRRYGHRHRIGGRRSVRLRGPGRAGHLFLGP